MNLLEVKNLYRNTAPKLPEVSFSLAAGEALALVGPNGAGKTSLLRCLLGLLDYNGEVLLLGKKSTNLNRKEIARKIAYVPQAINSDCQLLVNEYLDLSFYSQGKINFSRKSEIVALLGLHKFLTQNFNTLSGGEKQKVLIAAAYCQNPQVYLFDEPFSALDIFTVKDILKIFDMLRQAGNSLVIALHDLSLVSKCADRVLQVEQAVFMPTASYVDNCNQVLSSQI